MIDVGKRIITKALGPPITGMVVCIYDVKYLCLNNPPLYAEYLKKYPGVQKLYGVLLDNPIRRISIDKFNGPMKHMLYLSQPVENFVYYPEEELEPFHDYIIEKQEEVYEDYDGFPGEVG